MHRLSTDFSTIQAQEGNATGWRIRAKLAVRPGPKIGLFKPGTHEVVDLLDCPDHHPAINKALKIVKEMEFLPYNEEDGSGDLRYIQLTVERKSGKVQLVLVSNGRGRCDRLASELEKAHSWHSLWINTQEGSTNTIFGNSWKRVYGEELLEEFGTYFHPACFIQANVELFEQVLVKIKQMLLKGKRVTEYYAGVGVIGLFCAEKIQEGVLIEMNPYAEECFRRAKPPTHLKFVAGPTEKYVDLLEEVLIVDPPRKGLDRDLLEAIKGSGLQQILYLSCNEESLKGDLDQLLGFGWRVEEVERFALFPGTCHIETLVNLWKT